MTRRRRRTHARLLTAALGVLASIALVVPTASATTSGASMITGTVAKAAHVTVSKPVAIDMLSQATLLAVSCPSAHFCAAIGQNGTFVVAKHGARHWSSPTLIKANGVDVNGLSCSSASFCLATTFQGGALTYNGHHWSTLKKRIKTFKQDPTEIDQPVVSCASRTFCLVVSQEGQAFRYNGHHWSSATRIEARAIISGLSCATRSFCVATDGTEEIRGEDLGSVITFNGVRWSKPKVLDGPHPLTAVSCATPTFCAAGGSTHAFMLGKHGWSKAKPDGGLNGMLSVSCPTAKHCEATDGLGDVSRFGGGSWSHRQPVDAAPKLDTSISPYVSCGSATSCAIVDYSGDALALTHGIWSARHPIDPQHGGLINVSCATASFCVAVDQEGAVLQYNGSHWTPAHELDRDIFSSPRVSDDPDVNGLGLISCPTPTFCAAANHNDGGGVPARAYTFNGQSWSAHTDIDGDNTLTGLSCTSSSFCMAIDLSGNFMTFNGATWSAPTSFDSGGYPLAVSCTSSAFCVAVDNGGARGQSRALVDQSGVWSAPVQISTRGRHHSLDAVSCATPTYCAAIGYFGAAAVFKGATWTEIEPPAKPDHTVTISVSCLPSERCVIAGETSMELIGTSMTKPFALTARGISCPTEHHCIAVNGNNRGDAYLLKLAS
jgi:hypothetical protein